jgi:carbonic anhydrase
VIDLLVPTVKSMPADERNLARCVPANAIAQAGNLSHRGPIVGPVIAEGKIRVVAAVYNIANGAVSVVR